MIDSEWVWIDCWLSFAALWLTTMWICISATMAICQHIEPFMWCHIYIHIINLFQQNWSRDHIYTLYLITNYPNNAKLSITIRIHAYIHSYINIRNITLPNSRKRSYLMPRFSSINIFGISELVSTLLLIVLSVLVIRCAIYICICTFSRGRIFSSFFLAYELPTFFSNFAFKQ